jgi:hypothetical protein
MKINKLGLFAILLLPIIASCNFNQLEKLNKPVGLTFNNEVFRWSPVENARSYKAVVDTVEEEE